MIRSLVALGLVASLALFVGACSDDDNKPLDGSVDAKAETIKLDEGMEPDAFVIPDTRPDMDTESNMGESCENGCKEGSPLCLIVNKSMGIQICSRVCTPDDENTPLINEDDCPPDFICSTFEFNDGSKFSYCLKKCIPSLTKNPCPASSRQGCWPTSTQFTDLDTSVCWFPACESNKDCAVRSDIPCATDGECTSLGTGAFCDDTRCALPGNCTSGGICGAHTKGKVGSDVGSPCKSDLDCPNNGICFEEDTSPYAIGVVTRNGYCVVSGCHFANDLPDFKCPDGSACHDAYYAGVCFKTCALDDASTCRGWGQDKGGDYECYDLSGVSFGGASGPAVPVCLNASNMTCDRPAQGLDCSLFAPQGNPFNMICRDRYTGVAKTDSHDPDGICLDDTASGPFETPTDAGPPDSAPPDSAPPDSVVPDTSAPDTSVVPDAGPAPDQAAAG